MDSKAKASESKAAIPPKDVVITNPAQSKADSKAFVETPVSKDVNIAGRLESETRKEFSDKLKEVIASEPQFDDPHGITLKDSHSQMTAEGVAPDGAIQLPSGTVDLIPLQEKEIQEKKDAGTWNPQAQPRVQRYFVKLPDNPTVRLQAADPYDAIRVYKKAMGIVHTIHDYTINPAD